MGLDGPGAFEQALELGDGAGLQALQFALVGEDQAVFSQQLRRVVCETNIAFVVLIGHFENSRCGGTRFPYLAK